MDSPLDWVLPKIDQHACFVCGDCVEICPHDVLALKAGEVVFQKPMQCTYCALCEQVCLQKAIRCEYFIIVKERKSET